MRSWDARYEDVEVLQTIKARVKDAKYRKICYHSIVLHTNEVANEHVGSENKPDIPNKKQRHPFGAG
jgi:hypothetical protein